MTMQNTHIEECYGHAEPTGGDNNTYDGFKTNKELSICTNGIRHEILVFSTNVQNFASFASSAFGVNPVTLANQKGENSMDAVMRRKKLQPWFSDCLEFIHSILRFRVDTQQNNVEKKCGFENTHVRVDKGLHLRRQIQSPKKKKSLFSLNLCVVPLLATRITLAQCIFF